MADCSRLHHTGHSLQLVACDSWQQPVMNSSLASAFSSQGFLTLVCIEFPLSSVHHRVQQVPVQLLLYCLRPATCAQLQNLRMPATSLFAESLGVSFVSETKSATPNTAF